MSHPVSRSASDPAPSVGDASFAQRAEQSRVTTAVACLECGYNLYGLAQRGACPECGAAVADSLSSDRLMFAPRWWLRRLRLGSVLLSVGVASHILLATLNFATDAWFSLPLRTWIAFDTLTAVVALVGVWCLTARDPQRPPEQRWLSARRVGRWGEVIAATGFTATWLVWWLIRSSGTMNPGTAWLAAAARGGGCVFTVVSWVALIAQLVLLRRFCDRADLPRFRKQWWILGTGLSAALALTLAFRGISLSFWLAYYFIGPTPFGSAATGSPDWWRMLMTAQDWLRGLSYLGLVVFGAWWVVLLIVFERTLHRFARPRVA